MGIMGVSRWIRLSGLIINRGAVRHGGAWCSVARQSVAGHGKARQGFINL